MSAVDYVFAMVMLAMIKIKLREAASSDLLNSCGLTELSNFSDIKAWR